MLLCGGTKVRLRCGFYVSNVTNLAKLTYKSNNRVKDFSQAFNDHESNNYPNNN